MLQNQTFKLCCAHLLRSKLVDFHNHGRKKDTDVSICSLIWLGAEENTTSGVFDIPANECIKDVEYKQALYEELNSRNSPNLNNNSSKDLSQKKREIEQKAYQIYDEVLNFTLKSMLRQPHSEQSLREMCVLLWAGADPNKIDQNGNTAIHRIANISPIHAESICNVLEQKGVNIDFGKQNTNGETILDVVQKNLNERLNLDFMQRLSLPYFREKTNCPREYQDTFTGTMLDSFTALPLKLYDNAFSFFTNGPPKKNFLHQGYLENTTKDIMEWVKHFDTAGIIDKVNQFRLQENQNLNQNPPNPN